MSEEKQIEELALELFKRFVENGNWSHPKNKNKIFWIEVATHVLTLIEDAEIKARIDEAERAKISLQPIQERIDELRQIKEVDDD